MLDNNLIIGGSLISIGIYAIYKIAAKEPKAITANENLTIINSENVPIDHLKVLSGAEIIKHLKIEPIIESCRDRMGFDASIFNKDCLPVLYSVAEWGQLLPASESHHHAQPGGLIIHLFETLNFSLRFRQGYLLPVGASPEEIPEKKHRWTYAVFLSALLHDIAKPIADINVKIYHNKKQGNKWHPLAGSMVDQNARTYSIDFDLKERNYDIHKKLPVILMQRLVPAHVLSWLAEDNNLIHELTQYLSGDSEYKGVLHEIVVKSDSESVRNNLLLGPRTRFSRAKNVPLIERLMEGLRLLLDEGHLSLNRPGAHGWVDEDKIWFVAGRIADEVREFLKKRESAEGIPGKDKNDRLFDTWQEYGALIPTEDNKAVWNVSIELADGWKMHLTVLCFPLNKLFKDPSKYPDKMNGKVIITSADDKTLAPTSLEDFSYDNIQSENIDLDQPELSDLNEQSLPQSNEQIMQNSDTTEPETHQSTTLANQNTSPNANPVAQTKNTNANGTELQDLVKTMIKPLPTINLKNAPISTAKTIENNTEYLRSDDMAKPVKRSKIPDAATLKAVAPAGQTKDLKDISTKKKPPSQHALRFMRWLQEGLADGSIPYNRADAMVHFVEEGMALVTPNIFRRFADEFGELGDGTPSHLQGKSLGLGIQREVTNARWNRVVNKSNMQKYSVVGYNGKGKNLLTAVVIVNPGEFINPLPEKNPNLVIYDTPIE